MDKLSTLLARFTFSARVFYTGEFCGSTQFNESEQVGHLHVVHHGPVAFHHDGRSTIHIDEPTLVFYPRAMNHRLCIEPGTLAGLVCATVAFQAGNRNALAQSLPDVIQIPLHKVHALAPTLDLLFNEASENQSGRRVMLDRLCDVLILQVIRHCFDTQQITSGMLAGMSDPGLSRALLAMHDDPARAWSVEELAETSSMSRSKFARHFHDVVGTAPAEYLTTWRIGLAQEMLKKDRPVKIVAVEVGYSSQPAFTKAFTAQVGLSPRAWLEQIRNAELSSGFSASSRAAA